MIIGTAGHIDHGKTALVRALTGVDTDRLPEEKRRCITIDLGFAPITLPGIGAAGVVDVPGHEDFVRTMVAGATGVDVALLVVAADEGVMPQTREHVDILNLLGVERAVVAITKTDLADADLIDAVREEVAELLRDTSLANASFATVSVVTSAGIPQLADALAAAVRGSSARPAADLARLPIDRVFAKSGAGTVVTGTLWSGRLRIDDQATVLPKGLRGRIRGLQVHGRAVDVAEAGSRVAVALGGISRETIRRGDTLVTADTWRATKVIRANVALLATAPGAVTARTPLRLHLGTSDVSARVVCEGGAMAPGETRPVRIVLGAPIVARAGDRFVLRRASPPATIGGGVVTDAPVPSSRARPFRDVALPARERLEHIVAEAGNSGVAVALAAMRVGAAMEIVDDAVADGVLVRVNGTLVSSSLVERLESRLLAWLSDYHARHPRDAGASVQTARSSLRVADGVAESVVSRLTARGAVSTDGPLVRRADWNAAKDDASEKLASALLAQLERAGTTPPPIAELERSLGRQAGVVARSLEQKGLLVKLPPDRYAAATVARTLETRLLETLDRSRGYTPTQLKAAVGVTRQYLIPWLEYFDRAGVSRRIGDERWFGPPKAPGKAPPGA